MPSVLVTTDGSANSLFGVRQVVREYSVDRRLEVHVLNVQVPFSRHIAGFVDGPTRAEFHREKSFQALAPARRVLEVAGVPHAIHADVGDKARCIAAAALRLGCERVVMGTSRRGLLLRWAVGSLTNQVVARSTVPVELVAGDPAGALERPRASCALLAGAHVAVPIERT